MLAGHIGLAFDSGLGVSASARARRPCQLRGAWLQTRSGRRVQELLATPPIESGVSRDESGARDEGGARDTPISGKRRAASLALALAITGGKRRVPGGPNQVASRARWPPPLATAHARHDAVEEIPQGGGEAGEPA